MHELQLSLGVTASGTLQAVPNGILGAPGFDGETKLCTVQAGRAVAPVSWHILVGFPTTWIHSTVSRMTKGHNRDLPTRASVCGGSES